MLPYSRKFCKDALYSIYQESSPIAGRTINVTISPLLTACDEIRTYENNSEAEGKYSSPMVLIGIYISIASLFCILAMSLDLLNGFINRKFWFPTKFFSLNAASITVIAVAMKLQLDLSSPMPMVEQQVAKIGGLAFMCTMMSNMMTSLASMDKKSLLANVTGLSIFVITLIVNIFIQIRTHVINPDMFFVVSNSLVLGEGAPSMVWAACIYMGILLFLLIIFISSAITFPTTKKILEFKYQATSKTTFNDQHPQESRIPNVEELRLLVKRYWIMAKTSSPQFVMASNPLSSASGMICLVTVLTYISAVWKIIPWHGTYDPNPEFNQPFSLSNTSVYKWSIVAIVIIQSIGIVLGSIAPILRCFTILSIKSFARHNRNHFLVFKVEKYWTQKLCEWKESRISFLSSSRRSRILLQNIKIHTLSLCIGFQKVIVVSCKIIGLVPIVGIMFVTHCSYNFKLVKAMLFTPPIALSNDDTNEDLSNYVLLLEGNMGLAKKTVKRISDSMNHLIQNAEKEQHNNLLKLLEESFAFNGVLTFDNGQCQSPLLVELVNSWSLPIISLTCIAIAFPNIDKNKVDNLLKSVGEGLLYTHLVEKTLNKASEYVNIRRATVRIWHEVEDKCKWLENTLTRSAYEGKLPTQIIKSFAHKAEEIINEFNGSTNGEPVKENLPSKVIAANSMYRIAHTIIHSYESNNLEIIEDELFAQLSRMIADILVACLTNIPRVVTMRCHKSAIEKRESSVAAAIDLLGRTTKIIKQLETRVLPNKGKHKLAFIDEWRLHLRQP